MITDATSKHQPVFSGKENKMARNMPFFDGTTLVFSQSKEVTKVNIRTTGNIWKRMRQNKILGERLKQLPREQQIAYRPWKLAYCKWSDKTVSAISTGLPEKMTERSPAFYREGDRIHLSFISGIPTSTGFHYRLYACSGPDLEQLDPPKMVSSKPLFFGFISPHHVCTGMTNIIQLSEKATGRSFRLRTSFHRISSVTFLANDPAKLLITGLLNRQHDCQTVYYDLSTENASNVSVNGPVYKSSMHENQLIYAQIQNDSFESRRLCYAEYSLSPSTIQISKEI